MRNLLSIIAVLAGLALAAPLAAEPAFVRLAAEDGALKMQSSDPDTGADTPFAIASVGKTFTAVAVLRLVERGALRLDAPVADLVPDEVAEWFDGLPGLRLHHLLTMTSGLPDYYTDDWLEDALDAPDEVQHAEGALYYAAADAPLFDPGEDFDYSNTNYVLLGLILEEATGDDYATVMQREVFRPAGLKNSFVFGSRALPADFARGHPERELMRQYYSGTGLGDGGIISTARDVTRFYRALFSEGRLLAPDTLAVLQEDPLGEAYGMGLEVEDGLVGHSGGDIGYSSDVRMDLASGDIAVVLIAEEDADTDWTLDRLER
jgi:D-alanyl-D-alanine carboxypeptidase